MPRRYDIALAKLAKYVKSVGGQRAAAPLLGCSHSQLSYLFARKKTLSNVTLAVRVEKLAGIPVKWWVRS